ncbi:hypothetical protein P278_15860 [Zhouia amylolytica AD3]|uniref:Uncharacterized protein n=1 Tax=Zhouia amylolytica AD3 TaxID=1286632 RepID=W2UPK1_9FLAO|nr:hypothetical protein P278_15860 [Zhouia amylolytica AD3]
MSKKSTSENSLSKQDDVKKVVFGDFQKERPGSRALRWLNKSFDCDQADPDVKDLQFNDPFNFIN